MKRTILTIFTVLALTSINMPGFGQDTGPGGEKEYASPEHFEEDIKNFEASDRKQYPPKDAIVCIGSSSMRGWHGTIHTDLAPLTLIARGFGGSTMNDALYYADRIVLPYKPRAIVIYEGDNDIAQGISPEKIADTFRKFVDKVHTQLPQCRIYVLSIKPSINRWHLWPAMKKANRLIEAECAKDKRLIFIDVSSAMLNNGGTPLKNIFQTDDLHMNREGYIIWRNTVRPVLVEAELQYETQKPATSTEAKE